MNINGEAYRTIWYDEDEQSVKIIDQTKLPHELTVVALNNVDAVCHAITSMQVRGAPLIGATAAYGIALACQTNGSTEHITSVAAMLMNTRPTAVNLRWAVDLMVSTIMDSHENERAAIAFRLAQEICDNDVAVCSRIGDEGLKLIEQRFQTTGSTVNILTHCNAGWLATVDWGTALAPIYKAFNKGIPIHIWVDETRPRNQGAFLTAWELSHHGVPHTVIPDNTGGHLMQHGQVDLCFVGTDRTTASGDVCNKIGTYLKALAAQDNNIPFYTAAPTSSIDWNIHNGLADIPIEQRHSAEVSHISGITDSNTIETVRLIPENTPVANYGFDVTPARLITGLITEFGVFNATSAGLNQLKQRCNQMT